MNQRRGHRYFEAGHGPLWRGVEVEQVGPNAKAKKLELRGGPLKCRHDYFYFQDPVVGFMHARLQTWFPLTMHVCLNGREWLARQMDAEGIGYLRRGNCFVHVADVERARKLLDRQLRISWTSLLNRIAKQANPAQKTIFGRHSLELDYDWSADESEWASDIMFRSAADWLRRCASRSNGKGGVLAH
jgi:hypothetical protein